MQKDSQSSYHPEEASRRHEQTIPQWEAQYPDSWILLEITAEDDGEPVRGRLIATADDLDNLQEVWKCFRNQGILTMLTYGRPCQPRPEVVVSAT